MQIIIPSVPTYSDCWQPFSSLMKKFWPDKPWETTLVSPIPTDNGYYSSDIGFDQVYYLDHDYGWAKNLYKYLDNARKHDIILLMQEDFFLSAPVKTDIIKEAYDMMVDKDSIDCFRIFPCPGADVQGGPKFGFISKTANYRVSCQAALWRTKHLKQILEKTTSPWDFEITGGKLIKDGMIPSNLYLSTYETKDRPLDYICTAIVSGQWLPDAIKLCVDNDIDIDSSRRPIRNPS